MPNFKTTFVSAVMFSVALGEVNTSQTKESLSQKDPLIISGILDKFSRFIDHNNSLRGSTKLGDPLLTNDVVIPTMHELQEDQMKNETRQL